MTKYTSLHKYISASVFIFHQGVSQAEAHLESSRIFTMETVDLVTFTEEILKGTLMQI